MPSPKQLVPSNLCTPIKMLRDELEVLSTHEPILLNNETCVYCASLLGKPMTTKEHVIGRRFVPRGTLAGQWNLILRACRSCNRRKSDLEDDLSAITMQPDMWGQFADHDPVLALEAIRKARSASRRTRKQVKDSSESRIITASLGPNGTMGLTFISPPQTDRQRVFELSRFHLTAFFYWITYNDQTKRGGYWPGTFLPVAEAVKSDWGNPTHRAFMKTVLDWTPRLVAVGANGFFRVAIRRHPSAICWSWALEWNHKHRIIGFFGEQAQAEAVFANFPQPQTHIIAQSANECLRVREEIALSQEEDQLFSLVL